MGSENQNQVSKVTNAIRLVYLLAMAFLVTVLFGISLADRNNVRYYWTELHEVNKATVTINGQTAPDVELPHVVRPVRAGDRITLVTSAETILYDNLLFKVSGASLDIYIDDVLYLSTGQPDTYPSFQRTPSPQITMIDLPTESGLKEFRLEYVISDAADSIELSEFYIGDSATLFIHMLRVNGLTFLISLALLIAGVTLTFISLMSIRATSVAIAMVWLGLSCLAFGVWNVSANDLTVYFLPVRSLVYSLGYVGMLAVVSPLTVFYRRVLGRPRALAFRLVGTSAELLALLAMVSHLSGVMPFVVTGRVIRPFVSLSLIAIGVLLIIDFFKLHEELARRLLQPTMLLSFFALLDLCQTILIGFRPVGSGFLQAGFLAFTVWMMVLGGDLVNQRFKRARQSERLGIEVEALANNLEKQRELYQRLSESSEQVRMMRHDMRHQLSALRGYIEAGDNNGAVAYLNQLDLDTPSFAQLMLTDNFAVNAVVSHYLLKAEANGIDTDLRLTVPSDLGRVNESDMGIIFGNLFENAIEASMYLPENQRVIRMRSQVVKNRLTLTVDNAFDGNYESRDGVFYSRKRTGKGIGLSSVQTIVERYDGSMKIEIANNQFMVSLMVKL